MHTTYILMDRGAPNGFSKCSVCAIPTDISPHLLSVDHKAATKIDRHHCFKSGNIPKTEGGQIHLIFVTVL